MANAPLRVTDALSADRSTKTQDAASPVPTDAAPTTRWISRELMTIEPMPADVAADPRPVARSDGAASAASAVSPMPDRLRDLIVGYASQVPPFSMSLLELARRTAADGRPITPEQIQRTRTEIIAQAPVSLLAQANHTGASVRALLRVAA
jgi:hypothetical protein